MFIIGHVVDINIDIQDLFNSTLDFYYDSLQLLEAKESNRSHA